LRELVGANEGVTAQIFFDPGAGNLQILVFPQGDVDQLVQYRVLELPPPAGADDGSHLSIDRPPLGGSRHVGALVVGADGATGEGQSS